MDTRAHSVSAQQGGPADAAAKAAPKRQRKPDEIERFKAWIVERGAELLAPTNEYEIVRFRGEGVVSVVYVNKKGRRSFTGRSQSAWDAFKAQSPTWRADLLPTSGQSKGAFRTSVLVRTLIQRDGDVCFYCGDPFTNERKRTKEHLVAKTHKGPEHISNLFLSCAPCNIEAGHLSAPEKIRMRDRKRRGVGSRLLHDALALVSGTEVAKRITAFLNPNLPELPTPEKTDV